MKTTATIDSLDPRTALVTILVISTLSIIISDPFWLLGLFVLTIGLLIYFNLDGRQIYDKIRKFIPLLLFLLVIQSIFSPSGTAILKIGTIPLITTGGIIKGLVIILRMMIIIFSAMPLLLFDSMKLVLGLIRFRIPY
ncbi:MAG: energy-coupling factor transporter transmembrane component T, partial [Dethiobacteria bacterium]